MTISQPIFLCGLALAALLPAAEAGAHGTNPGVLLLRLAGDTLYVTASPDMSVFRAFDDDGDGRIGRAELRRHRPAMLAAFERGLVLRAGGKPGRRLLADIATPHTHGRRATHLRVTLRYRWSEAPRWLEIDYRLAARSPVHVRAQRVTAAPLARQRPLGPVVTARLDATRSRLRLFETPKTTPAPKE